MSSSSTASLPRQARRSTLVWMALSITSHTMMVITTMMMMTGSPCRFGRYCCCWSVASWQPPTHYTPNRSQWFTARSVCWLWTVQKHDRKRQCVARPPIALVALSPHSTTPTRPTRLHPYVRHARFPEVTLCGKLNDTPTFSRRSSRGCRCRCRRRGMRTFHCTGFSQSLCMPGSTIYRIY